MSVTSTFRRWLAGRDKLAADLPAAEERLAEIEASPPKTADPAEHLSWVEKRDAARREVEALRSALAIATAEAAKAEAAQAEADDEKRHAAEEKQAKGDTALVAKATAAGETLIAAIEELEASNARTAEYNSQRGSRPFVTDAETRVRQIPSRTVPAVFEEREQWLDSHGNQPFKFRQNAEGEMEPMEPIYTKQVVRVCVRPERIEPAKMPDRYAELLPLLRKAFGNDR